jgi:glycine cleavage system H protein
MFPAEFKYTKTHEWVSVSGDIATIGLTNHAQEELGDIVFVELPEVGRTLDLEEPFGVVESVKAVSDLYSPLTGEVAEVNEELESAPETVNEAPHDKGWLIKIKLSSPEQVDNLLDSAAYEAHVKEEAGA